MWLFTKKLNLGRDADQLFSYLNIGTQKRADLLTKALKDSITVTTEEGPQLLEGYLRKRIKALHLALITRGEGAVYSRGGVNPGTVDLLAKLLPHLQSLDLSIRDFTLDGPMRAACSQFTQLKELQVEAESALCFDEIMLVVFSLKLESLKLKEVTDHIGGAMARTITHYRTSAPEKLAWAQNLRELVLWGCIIGAGELEAIFSTLPPDGLQRLVLHRVRSGGRTSTNEPELPYQLHAGTILPFLPHLESFHLVLFDRPPITNTVQRQQLRNGDLLSMTSTASRPPLANDLVSAFSNKLTHLTLGGYLCFTPYFFETLPFTSISHLRFQNCADMSRDYVDGLTVDGFLELLDKGGWTTSLTSLTLSGMAEEHLHTRDPLWDWDAMKLIEDNLKRLNAGRSQKIILHHDAVEPVLDCFPHQRKLGVRYRRSQRRRERSLVKEGFEDR